MPKSLTDPWIWVFWYLPSIIAVAITAPLGLFGIGVFAALTWSGFLIWKNGLVIEQNKFGVKERWGKFDGVLFWGNGWFGTGFHVLIPFIERLRPVYVNDWQNTSNYGDLRSIQLQVYGPDDENKIDLVDASVVLKAYMWFRIGTLEDCDNGNWDQLTEDIRLWAYAYQSPLDRIYDLVESVLRPLIQTKTVDQASVDRNGMADTVMNDIRKRLDEIGARLPTDVSQQFVIEDIGLSEADIEVRRKRLSGEMITAELLQKAGGWIEAARQMATELKITEEAAMQFLMDNRGLDVLQGHTGLTLVGNTLGGVLGTLNVGNRGKES